MAIAYLNGDFMPLEEARISPMDRGFLFGDGIYEVIPTHYGKAVGLQAHLQRLNDGLQAIGIANPMNSKQWESLVNELVGRNRSKLNADYVGVYLHVSRGTAMTRAHGFPDNVTPTVFAYGFTMASPPAPRSDRVKGLDVALGRDLRWERCHIKSTSLLGNVLHFQDGKAQGKQETILLNASNEVTEASSCNVFVVIKGEIITPPLDHQLLPGITRKLVIASLAKAGITVTERAVTQSQLCEADEVWLTSSSKEITPVLSIDDSPVDDGTPGPVWQQAISIFNQYKYDL